ncbi:MAG TPA: metalloregulator ArsR/SmtB family transcription factor [Actinomycetota bacterium]
MEAALKALADDRRRTILRLVWDDERSAGEIASHFDVSRPAISQHLAVMKGAGLIAERREGTFRYYSAHRERLEEIKQMIESFWDAGLGRLKREAERDERDARRKESRKVRKRP